MKLRHGRAGGPSLRERLGKAEQSACLAQYLDSGTVVIATAGALTHDVLSADSAVIGRLAILTDGSWAWPSDLGYYVAKYAVGLNPEFVRHVTEANCVAPILSREQLKRLGGESRIPDE